MSHIFDERKFAKLDNPERRKILPVQEVIEIIGLDKSMIVADVGCGIGYFTFPLAEASKKVYGIDISELMINELVRRNHSDKVIPILGDFIEKLKEHVDVFFASTVIHELDNLEKFTKNAIDKLNAGGRLVYLDFQKKDTGFGPSVEKRVSADFVMDLFEECGLHSIEKAYLNDVFYIVSGRK